MLPHVPTLPRTRVTRLTLLQPDSHLLGKKLFWDRRISVILCSFFRPLRTEALAAANEKDDASEAQEEAKEEAKDEAKEPAVSAAGSAAGSASRQRTRQRGLAASEAI